MRKLPLALISSILVVLVVAIVFKSNAKNNDFQVCLFSAISGTVTLHGKPLPNITITRSANYWNKDNHTDEAKTDANGRFHFESMIVQSRHISRSLNPIIFETLIIHYQGKEYMGWDTTSEETVPNMELGNNKPIPPLTCELSHESKRKELKNGSIILGVCDW